MWEQLIAKVKETLEKADNVKDVFSIPKSKITKFPAVFFKPAGFQNSFETQSENMAVYHFMAIAFVGTSGTTPEVAFGTILPHVVDNIIAQFNEDWDGGTIDGHRVSVKIDSSDAWEMQEDQDGITAYAPLSIEIKLLTSN
jgi:hypothetical protein